MLGLTLNNSVCVIEACSPGERHNTLVTSAGGGGGGSMLLYLSGRGYVHVCTAAQMVLRHGGGTLQPGLILLRAKGVQQNNFVFRSLQSGSWGPVKQSLCQLGGCVSVNV